LSCCRLEKVAQKLSLNLTHIIVYSCCVKVPSKRLPLLHITSDQGNGKLHLAELPRVKLHLAELPRVKLH